MAPEGPHDDVPDRSVPMDGNESMAEAAWTSFEEALAFDALIDGRLATGSWPDSMVGIDDRGDLAGMVDALLSLRAAEWPAQHAGMATATAVAFDDLLELRLRLGEWPAADDEEALGPWDLAGTVEGLLSLPAEDWARAAAAGAARRAGPSDDRPLEGAPARLHPRRAHRRPARLLAVAAAVVLVAGALAGLALGSTSPGTGGQQAATTAHLALVGDTLRLNPVAGPSAPSGVTSVACVTATTCVALGDGPSGPVTALTTDGGGTWHQTPAPAGVTDLQALTCTSGRCWAVGAAGSSASVITSEDGGATWASQAVPAGVGPLHDVACPTDQACRAVGATTAGASILTTDDGGSTWTARQAPTGTSALEAVSCPDATDCAASGRAGSSATVIATDDGGATWSAQPVVVVPGPGSSAATSAPLVNASDVLCPTGSACTGVAFDAQGAARLLQAAAPIATWQASDRAALEAGATGNASFVVGCVGTDCPMPSDLGANTALRLITGSTGVSLSGASAALTCWGGTSHCWMVQPTASGYVASMLGASGGSSTTSA